MLRFVLFLAVGSILGFGLASCTAKPGCASNSDCPTGQICKSGGTCGKNSSGGGTGEGGGSVNSGGDTGDTGGTSGTGDTGGSSGTGDTGGSSGTGGSGGTNGSGGSNGSGNESESNGGGGGGSGSSSGSGADAGCGEMFTPTITEANLMIVLDKSSSMLETVEGTAKWDAAVAAIKQVMTQYPAIHFGLEMFSVPSEGLGTNCKEGPGKIYVPIAANTQEEIAGSMVDADGNGTPIAGGLVVGGADPALLDPTRTEGVIVVTDGQENCLGKPVDEVAKLLARPVSVKTWVVGFGSAVDPRTLNSMAEAGGTARPGDPRYYQADAPADLVAALSAIARSATCSFTLTQAPPDPAQVNIVVNGQSIPRDPTHASGWDYDPATNRVTLYGAACQGLGNTGGAGGAGGSSASQIGVQFACASGGGGADDTAPATDPVPVPVPRPDDD